MTNYTNYDLMRYHLTRCKWIFIKTVFELYYKLDLVRELILPNLIPRNAFMQVNIQRDPKITCPHKVISVSGPPQVASPRISSWSLFSDRPCFRFFCSKKWGTERNGSRSPSNCESAVGAWQPSCVVLRSKLHSGHKNITDDPHCSLPQT